MGIAPQYLVAHRGYQRHFPENTLLSVREAIAVGAQHVEIDVQLGRDHVPVVYHDDTLERMSAQRGKVSDLAVAELQQLSAHEPGRFGERFRTEKIAALAALVPVIRANPSITFYIELKEEAVRDHSVTTCLQQLAMVLEPVLAQCVLISFDLHALLEAPRYGFPRVGPVLRDWGSRNREIDRLGASVMFINKKRIPAYERIAAHCPVVVYEVDQLAEAKELLQRGASMVETFAIGELTGNPLATGP